jgi:ABC-type uncharacterized transport system substrate-binding protein
MRLLVYLYFGILLITTFVFHSTACAVQKKIVYIASYHVEKGEWTAGIMAGIGNVLKGRKDVSLEVFNMDTRLSKTEEEKMAAALQAKALIDRVKPDVVITSDDNAAKYLILPYYKNGKIPFVFCGLNWDASVYELPYTNTTGMIEIQLIGRIVDYLSPLAKGKRIAALRGDTLSNRKEQEHFEKHLNLTMDTRYVMNFQEWKKEFLKLQDETDMLILGSLGALNLENASMKEVEAFVSENIKVPTAAYDSFMNRISLLTLSTIPEEQGEWAAEKALEILNGTPPGAIPIVTNKKAKIFLNMKLARKLGIKFPMELIEISHLVSARLPKILYINSYHEGYKWSDDIEKGLKKSLNIVTGPDGNLDTTESPVEMKIFRMDTKLQSSEEQKIAAAEKARNLIEQWQPDLVVASDDNVSKFLIAPYYMGSELPFVFCGLNWDASVYGFPVDNITGMVEVAPFVETIQLLKNYASGDRVAYLGADDMSNRKEISYHSNLLHIDYSGGSLVSTFDEWKKEYLRLQDEAEMLILINPVGISGWDRTKAEEFILKNTHIPTGAAGDNVIHLALLGVVNIGEEQGWWAGKTALRILDGTAPSAIPVTTNKNTRVYVNTYLAKKLGIKFPLDLLEKATLLPNEILSPEKIK